MGLLFAGGVGEPEGVETDRDQLEGKGDAISTSLVGAITTDPESRSHHQVQQFSVFSLLLAIPPSIQSLATARRETYGCRINASPASNFRSLLPFLTTPTPTDTRLYLSPCLYTSSGCTSINNTHCAGDATRGISLVSPRRTLLRVSVTSALRSSLD